MSSFAESIERLSGWMIFAVILDPDELAIIGQALDAMADQDVTDEQTVLLDFVRTMVDTIPIQTNPLESALFARHMLMVQMARLGWFGDPIEV